MNILVQVSWLKHAGVIYRVYMWAKIAGPRICMCLTFLENAQLFSKWLFQFAHHLVADVVV